MGDKEFEAWMKKCDEEGYSTDEGIPP